MTSVLDRFLKYVAVDTESAYNASSVPSTEKQKDLAFILADELRAFGAADVCVSESGCLYVKLAANCAGAQDRGVSAHHY